MKTLDITVKDLVQIIRDRQSLLFLVAMPVIFTFVMSFAYRGSQPDPDADIRLALAWINQDEGGLLSTSLEQMLVDSDTLRLVAMEESAALESLRKNEVAGVLIVPADFSARWQESEASQLSLVTDSASMTGQSLYQALRGPVTRLMSAVEIARLDARMMKDQKLLSSLDADAEFLAAYQLAQEQWVSAGSSSMVQTRLAAVPAASDPYGGNPYNQSSPGILVMFAIFGLVSSAQILVQERKSKTLERMITTSTSPATVVGGHFLAMFALTLGQQILLVAFGQLALSVDYLSAPLGTLAMMVTLSLCVASIGLLIGVVARGDQQVILYAMVAMFTFSGLGGVWFPLEGAGKTFAAVGKLTPTAWAMTGFQNIVLRGLDSVSTVLPAAILLLYTGAFFLIAVWRFRKVL